MADWDEEEIYRIDHFLGDEMVRSINHLRFANEQLVEPLFNNEKVGAVMIDMLEEFGCDGRGGYFDEFGMIRDVHQNRTHTSDLANRRPASGGAGFSDGQAEFLTWRPYPRRKGIPLHAIADLSSKYSNRSDRPTKPMRCLGNIQGTTPEADTWTMRR